MLKKLSAFVAAFTIALMPGFGVMAADKAESFTDAQRTEIENVVRELLTKKDPEIIATAVQELKRKSQMQSAADAKDALQKNHDKIFNDPDSFVGGNPKGDVTIVEFFDYQCGYCKMAHGFVQELLQDDKNIRFVYKEFPILGDGSLLASRAAIASIKQKKYEKFHNALMENKSQLSEDAIMNIAKTVGLDPDQLKKDMASEKVSQIIETDRELGNQLGIRGTPMFIIGEQTFPGALGLDQMKKAIEEARAAKAKKD